MKKAIKMGLLAAVYVAFGHWGLHLRSVGGFATPIWAPTGFSLAALYLWGEDLWPGVTVGAFIVNAIHGAFIPVALLFAAGNTLEAVIGSRLLRRYRFSASMNHIRDVFILLGGTAPLSTLVSATVGALALFLFRSLSYSASVEAWKVWWRGDFLSDLIVASFIFVWSCPIHWKELSWKKGLEAGAVGLFILWITALVFKTPAYPHVAHSYLIYPPLIWASLRFGPRGAVSSILSISVLAFLYTFQGSGPFALTGAQENLWSMEMFTAVTAITGLIFAAIASELAESKEALRASRDNLEQTVQERTKDLVSANSLLRDSIAKQQKMMDQLKTKDEELFQARKLEAIGRLAGGVAHDFNNLITGILGISQELKSTFTSSDPRREEVDEIIKASNRAFEVTRQLLAFGRRQIISPKVVDINATIRDFAKLLHRLIGEDVTLDLRLSESSYVRIDPGNLGQVLLNLTLNARDAMPHGGTIVMRTENVRASKKASGALSSVLLEVSDTGKGMDSQTLSHIFEPFFTTKSNDRGTGLGLATVYGVVKQSGGDITVKSEPGQGTTFRIFLPRELTMEEKEAAHLKAAVPSGTGRGTILVVEDEDIVRRVVVKQLTRAGYTVLEARAGKKALSLLDAYGSSVNLIVTDVVMPEMNGREVVERVRARYPQVAVLYMSGYPENIIANRGTLEPGIDFIEKSSIQGELISKVREILDRSSSAAA